MAKISLKVRANKEAEEKIYEADGYDLLMGTVEDFIDIIDLDKINDNVEVAKMVVKGIDQIRPLIKDVFPELTDEEFRRVSVNDLIQTIIEIGKSVVENLNVLAGSKN